LIVFLYILYERKCNYVKFSLCLKYYTHLLLKYCFSHVYKHVARIISLFSVLLHLKLTTFGNTVILLVHIIRITLVLKRLLERLTKALMVYLSAISLTIYSTARLLLTRICVWLTLVVTTLCTIRLTKPT